jgi:hypothetical protein
MAEQGMQRKNVGTYIPTLFVVSEIIIITSVGIDKY